MLDRTQNQNNRQYANYGGRGIRVCQEWYDFSAFERDMGPSFSPNLELDRIDVNGDYEPANCRWATREQQQNNRRNNHVVEWRGVERTVREWADRLGLKPNTLLYRLRRGWEVERAMTHGVPDAVLLEIANP